mgnify:CR=1 FL=1
MEIETDEITDIQGIPANANPDKLTYKLDYSNLENLKGKTVNVKITKVLPNSMSGIIQ